MRPIIRSFALGLALLLTGVVPGLGQAPQPTPPGHELSAASQDIINAEAFALNLSVPESPAFVALGITPDKVTRPTSPRQIGAALLNGVDDQGNLQTGVAIDFVPYLALGGGDDLTLARYRQNDFGPVSMRRLASRFALSAATSKGTDSDDKSVRLAVGFRLTPWDEGDARTNTSIDRCVTQQHDEILDHLHSLPPYVVKAIAKQQGGDPTFMWNRLSDELKEHGAEWVGNAYMIPAFVRDKDGTLKLDKEGNPIQQTVASPVLDTNGRQALDKDGRPVWRTEPKFEPLTLPFSAEQFEIWEQKTAKCFEDAKLENWNAAAWDMGIAPTWVSESSGFSELGSAGGTMWSSLSLNLPGNDWWGFQPRVADAHAGETDVYRFMREHFQVLLHARYRWDTRVDNPTNMPPDSKIVQDDALLGGRLRAGVPRYAISAEAAWVRENPMGMPANEGQRYAVSGEVRITDSVWIQVSAGSSDGIDSGGDEGFVLGSLRYGLSTESPYDTWRAGVR